MQRGFGGVPQSSRFRGADGSLGPLWRQARASVAGLVPSPSGASGSAFGRSDIVQLSAFPTKGRPPVAKTARRLANGVTRRPAIDFASSDSTGAEKSVASVIATLATMRTSHLQSCAGPFGDPRARPANVEASRSLHPAALAFVQCAQSGAQSEGHTVQVGHDAVQDGVLLQRSR